MQVSEALFCLVVAIFDGDTFTARCGEPEAYEQVKVWPVSYLNRLHGRW